MSAEQEALAASKVLAAAGEPKAVAALRGANLVDLMWCVAASPA